MSRMPAQQAWNASVAGRVGPLSPRTRPQGGGGARNDLERAGAADLRNEECWLGVSWGRSTRPLPPRKHNKQLRFTDKCLCKRRMKCFGNASPLGSGLPAPGSWEPGGGRFRLSAPWVGQAGGAGDPPGKAEAGSDVSPASVCHKQAE